jgi:hypothetical protein
MIHHAQKQIMKERTMTKVLGHPATVVYSHLMLGNIEAPEEVGFAVSPRVHSVALDGEEELLNSVAITESFDVDNYSSSMQMMGTQAPGAPSIRDF